MDTKLAKICTKCRRELPIACFGKHNIKMPHGVTWKGRHSTCRECRTEYNRQRHNRLQRRHLNATIAYLRKFECNCNSIEHKGGHLLTCPRAMVEWVEGLREDVLGPDPDYDYMWLKDPQKAWDKSMREDNRKKA